MTEQFQENIFLLLNKDQAVFGTAKMHRKLAGTCTKYRAFSVQSMPKPLVEHNFGLFRTH